MKTTIDYLQTKIDYFKDFRYLHEDVNDEVCTACDKAIEYLEKVIEDLEESTDEEYQEAAQQRADDLEASRGQY